MSYMYIPDAGDTTTVGRMMAQLNDFLSSPTATETFSLKTPAKTPQGGDIRSGRKRRAEELDSRSSLLVASAEKARLEAEVNDLKLSRKRDHLENLMSPSKAQDGEKLSRLNEELARVRKDNERLKEKISEMDERSLLRRQEMEGQARRSHKELEELRDELQREKSASIDAQSKANSVNHLTQRLKQVEDLADIRCEELRAELNEYKQQSHQLRSELSELRPLQSEVTSLQQKLTLASHEAQQLRDTQAIADSVGMQLTRLEHAEQVAQRLQQENSQLKLSQRNFELQQEKVLGLETKLSRMQERLQKYEAMELQYQELLEVHEKWQTFNSSGDRPRSPMSFTSQVADLQQQQVVAMAKNAELGTRVRVSESRLQEALSQLQNTERQLVNEREARVQVEELSNRKDRRNQFLAQERNGLRQILNSYETMEKCDQALALQMKEMSANIDRYQVLTKELQDDVVALTNQLSNERRQRKQAEVTAKSCEEQLSAGLQATASPPAVDQSELHSLRCIVRELEKEVTALKDENKKLVKENHQQSSEAVVFHFADNPFARQRLQKAESDARSHMPASQQELMSVKEELDIEKKQKQRIEEMCRKKIIQFRMLVMVLFGWKVDMKHEGRYELRSIYSPANGDHLLFKCKMGWPFLKAADNTVELIATPLSAQLQDYIKEHLIQANSFPAFLAAVTLDLHLAQC